MGGARPVSIRFLNHRISGLSSTINGFITSLLQMVFCLCRITVERIAPGIEAPPYFAIRGSTHFYGWEYLWASKKTGRASFPNRADGGRKIFVFNEVFSNEARAGWKTCAAFS